LRDLLNANDPQTAGCAATSLGGLRNDVRIGERPMDADSLGVVGVLRVRPANFRHESVRQVYSDTFFRFGVSGEIFHIIFWLLCVFGCLRLPAARETRMRGEF